MLTLKSNILFLHFVSVLVCFCSHIEQASSEGSRLLLFCFSCENTGNESLFVGMDWNSLAELSRDPVRDSTGQNSEVLAGLVMKCLRLKEPQDRKQKTCLDKGVVEKFMAYLGWGDQEHRRSQKIWNTNVIFYSNPNICNTTWNFLFCNILNQEILVYLFFQWKTKSKSLDFDLSVWRHMCSAQSGMTAIANCQKLQGIY